MMKIRITVEREGECIRSTEQDYTDDNEAYIDYRILDAILSKKGREG